MDLSTYVRIGRYDLPEPTRTAAPANSVLAQEVSAVTYNWDTDSLFVVGDGGTSIVQISKTGQLINSMTLATGSSPQGTEFYDPEGLAYIGNGQFVMTEERDRTAVKFTYTADTTLTRADAQTAHLGTNVGNIGLEGLTYDPLTGGFIFVKETSPEGVFQTTIDFATDTASNGSATTVNSVNLFDPALANVLDFADVFALSNNPALSGQADEDHLLLLSQESAKIVEIDRSGTVISSLNIVSDPGNPLNVASQQHEGLTMDRDGYLYVVSENGGGDFDHPQLWVYAPSAVANAAPTAITLTNPVTAIDENTSTVARIKVADVAITDDGLGTNNLTLSGADAGSFEIDGTGLYIKAGTILDYETKTSYSVTANVDDVSVGATPDASSTFTLNVNNVVNENNLPAVTISEVAPWSSGNSPVAADWFEVTNNGSSALDISGWRVDDSSNAFGSSLALNGITSIAAGESVIFFETANLAATSATFINTWFGGNAPAGLHFGSYSGSGVGLSTGGDAVNLFNSAGVLQASVAFGPSPNGPFTTFNNAASLNNATISTPSVIGVNGAFAAANDTAEIGSPGTVGKLIISEIAPWSSGNSPVGADWFEVTNTTVSTIDLTGWKVDDSSGSPAAALALNGITSIAPGESVIFIESSNPAAARTAFLNNWFGGNAPAGLQIGTYSGSGIGLSTSGDAVNLYDSTNALRASVTFGASPAGPFPTFDNAAGKNSATISTLSSVGTNAAFAAVNDTAEVGSPGEIIPINSAPIGVNDSAAGLLEDGSSAAAGNVLTNDKDADLVQTSTEVLSISAARAGTEAAGGALGAVSGATIVDGVYGQLTLNPNGGWSYALDNSRGTTQALVEGQTVVESFTYQVKDAHGLVDTAQIDLSIVGADEPLTLTGTAKTDTLVGGGGNDTLKGLAGLDMLIGNGGDDDLDGGANRDTMIGGTGNDSYHVDNAFDVVTENTDEGSDTVISSIQMTLGANIENGLLTGAANLRLSGNGLDNVLTGNDGNNRLEGFDGDDHILGGLGSDLILGGLGTDIMTGGLGADRFQFGSTAETGIDTLRDVITDFEAGIDRIALNLIDANVLKANNQAFKFIGDSDFGHVAGQLRAYADSGNTVVAGDTNGDGIADFEIQLTGAHVLTGADFLL